MQHADKVWTRARDGWDGVVATATVAPLFQTSHTYALYCHYYYAKLHKSRVSGDYEKMTMQTLVGKTVLLQYLKLFGESSFNAKPNAATYVLTTTLGTT